MRVSTSTMTSVLLSQAMKTQAEYNQTITEQASGLKRDSYVGLNGSAGLSVSLSSDLATSEALVTRSETAQTQVETAYGAISSIIDIVQSALVDITGAINGTTDTTDSLQESAQGWMEDVADLLNTDVGDVYVFAGAGGASAPVDLADTDYDPTADTTTADTGYYQGSASTTTIMVDGSIGLEYGITADDPAFEQTLRALSILANMTTDPVDTDALREAYALLDSANGDLGEVQESLSTQSDRLDTVIDQQTEFQLYAESALESVQSVDVAEATAKASEQEVILQASFSALSSFLNLSLMDYLS
ncbi:MAG: flagellin [Rhodospirillum sp.]|nr:flagellin [Rhodospirillum sp.]MCF8491693.1 flagellin [Rhodospirillum sp.]MCF8501082.1 flagellin [Rhodospirillum sp.]